MESAVSTEKINEEIQKKESKGQDASGQDTVQFVTFLIHNEVYGVEVLKVQEIIGMTQITHMPNSMSFMKGVINLRGSVVPVVDMRLKLRMDEREYDQYTVILIVETRGMLIGMIVDSVSDVISMPISSVQDTPHFSVNIDTDYIRGIGKLDDQLVILLDVDRILSVDEINSLKKERAEL